MHMWSLLEFTFYKRGEKLVSFVIYFISSNHFLNKKCHSRISRGGSSIWVSKRETTFSLKTPWVSHPKQESQKEDFQDVELYYWP